MGIRLYLNPASICLIQIGKKGLELVKAYPRVFPENVMNEITLKSMPLNAKDGTFTTNTIGNT